MKKFHIPKDLVILSLLGGAYIYKNRDIIVYKLMSGELPIYFNNFNDNFKKNHFNSLINNNNKKFEISREVN